MKPHPPSAPASLPSHLGAGWPSLGRKGQLQERDGEGCQRRGRTEHPDQELGAEGRSSLLSLAPWRALQSAEPTAGVGGREQGEKHTQGLTHRYRESYPWKAIRSKAATRERNALHFSPGSLGQGQVAHCLPGPPSHGPTHAQLCLPPRRLPPWVPALPSKASPVPLLLLPPDSSGAC